jgi:iron complex transport system permease protein
MSRAWTPLWLALATLVLALLCLGVGRYGIAPQQVLRILFSSADSSADITALQRNVVEGIRLPRVLLAALVGAGLAGAGAALQSLLRNPLAEPQLLGVSSGAAFGGVLAFLLMGDGWPVIAGAFVFGLLALFLVFWLAAGGSSQRGGTVLLVLAGIVVSALFAAGVSLTKLLADPQNQLPAIVFWLMGSLSAADSSKLLLAAPVMGFSLLLLWSLRFSLMALAVGEDDARSLGVKVGRVRLLTLLAVGLIAACSVALCGIVGWVGLVVPHLVRLLLGTDHRSFMLNCMLGGAAYLIAVDTLARSASSLEIPLGVLTALFGAPLFAILVRRLGRALND